MSRSSGTFDAIVVGSGPNGLAAAIRLAQEGLSVLVYEAAATPGGGMRTKELMQNGVRHDICSAIHPLGVSSPYLSQLTLDRYGLEWVHPPVAAAHPLEDRPAAILTRDLHETAFRLGEDEQTYLDIVTPIVENWSELTRDFLGPLSIPKHPLKLASFGLKGLLPSSLFSKRFKTIEARALLAGMAAHSILPLNSLATTAIGLVFYGAAHTNGWPMARGGSQSLAGAMVAYAEELGVQFEYSKTVRNIDQLPPAKAVLFDLTPIQVANIASSRLPGAYINRLKKFRYGQGVFKIDYVLKEPVPWADKECRRAGTVHLGGTFDEIAESERSMDARRHSERPFVLVAQQSLFDDSRTPDDRHTLWAYCHVPNGSDRDMTREIENQIERFAPGFRDVIDQKQTMNCRDFQQYNMNYIGGDINGGRQDITQLFSRPAGLFNPYATPADGIYFCSSSTPPGGGVHGMCGYHAATLALKKEFGFRKADFSVLI